VDPTVDPAAGPTRRGTTTVPRPTSGRAALKHGRRATGRSGPRQRAEKIAVREDEWGRRSHGTRGRSGRPHGKSAPEQDTGVAPQAPIDEESPHLPTGDQAG
jgi:hypothetical protein